MVVKPSASHCKCIKAYLEVLRIIIDFLVYMKLKLSVLNK